MIKKAYGSGYFGEWITDEFGLPAYRYTCDQINDPKAQTKMRESWRPRTEHLHQVGNDRLVGVASNYGHIRVRQDEGSPKYLNDYDPSSHQYGGGFGYLTDGTTVLSTFYSGQAGAFDRVFGVGYYRKSVRGNGLAIDQTVFAPYGDDPILISQVKIESSREEPAELRWVEYWGCQPYQFSFKALMRSVVTQRHPSDFRRDLANRFKHDIKEIRAKRGLIGSKQFMGHRLGDRFQWSLFNLSLRSGIGKKLTGGPVKSPVKEAVLEDLAPPPVFLVSLDAPFDGFATDAKTFFGEGGADSPEGLKTPLPGESLSNDTTVGLFLERKLQLAPGETKTVYFAYGYLPDGFDLDTLLSKYEKDLPSLLPESTKKWNSKRIQLTLDDAWVDRELAWHNYYLRGNLTYDSFFKEHILSQGHVYQYIIGFQGAARDPLQHALPFVFCEPYVVKDVIRYTLKTVTPEGEIPYGITGSGMYMPSPFRPSDQELWLLWLASEYVLATRDLEFLDERISTYPVYGRKAGAASVREILLKCYKNLTESTGSGKHGLQRLSNGDWNDAMVLGYVSDELQEAVEEAGESVLNAAMASYSLDIYSRMLRYSGDAELAEEALQLANSQKEAVRAQWAGKWFRRAWLTNEIGWVGEDNLWLEPQPWAIIGGAAEAKQARILAQSIDEVARQSSKIGALVLGKPDGKMAGDGGIGTNAGIWPSINGTLVWALALVDGSMAWDEWKKNSLACHAENYPDIWYGIWSGPDTYNSEFSDFPGGTIHKGEADSARETKEERDLERVGSVTEVLWTDFPVMNQHPHAWPLYTVAKLMGIEFNSRGVDLSPTLPKEEYRFITPLVELEKSKEGYNGRYGPKSAGSWRMTLKLDGSELERVTALIVNGKSVDLTREGDRIVWEGESKPESPLTWSIKF